MKLIEPEKNFLKQKTLKFWRKSRLLSSQEKNLILKIRKAEWKCKMFQKRKSSFCSCWKIQLLWNFDTIKTMSPRDLQVTRICEQEKGKENIFK